jgi:hypothetical protein
MIQFRKEIKNLIENKLSPLLYENSFFTYAWLSGFIEGYASFSTNNILNPCLKFKHTIAKENLFKLIKSILGLDINIQYPKLRVRYLTDKKLVVLDYN